MVGVSLLIQGKTKDVSLGKLLLTGVKSVSAHCQHKADWCIVSTRLTGGNKILARSYELK